MRKLAVAALLSAQLLPAAQPAFAADFATTQEQRVGTFAGFRLRIPLDGNPRERQIRAGLAFAPTLQSRAMDGETRSRIGEGLEFGYRTNRPLSFSIAGQDLSGRRFGAAQDNDDHHRGFPWGTAALVVGGILVAGVIATAVIFNEISDNESS